MAARPNPDEYSLPAKWVPVNGELARGRCLASLSETERAIFYNQDVLYHQNLEILQMLDNLKAQNSDASSNSSSRRALNSAASEEVGGVQKPLVEMPAPPVPSVRLPPVNKEEPQSPSTTPTVPPVFSLSIPLTSSLDSGSTAATGRTPLTPTRSSSVSGSAPISSTFQNPQGLSQTVNVPSWQEKFNDLLGTKNEQGKRKTDSSDSEEDKNHYPASTRFREEFSKAKDDSAEPSIGFAFSTIGGNSNARIAGTSNLAQSSPVGFHASASKPEGNLFGTRSPFSSIFTAASACLGTGSTPFEAYLEKESADSSTWLHYQSINLMLAYRTFSFEELRLADYTCGRKFGASTTLAGFTFANLAQRSPAGFGSINRFTTDGSSFANAATASSSSSPAASIFGRTLASQPTFNGGTRSGSGWAFKSKTNNTPSEVGKFSDTTAAAGLQTQSQGQNLGFGSQPKEPLKPTGNLFSTLKPWPVTPGAPNSAASSPSRPAANFFKGTPASQPTSKMGTPGSGWAFNSTTTNTPSEVGKFSDATAAAALQAQSQGQNHGFGSQSKEPLQPTGNLFSISKPWPVTPAAPNPAAPPPTENAWY